MILGFYEILAGFTVYCILYSFLDAWHDKKIINKETSGWHKVDSFIKGYVTFGIVCALFIVPDFIVPEKLLPWFIILFIGYGLFLRWNTFDWFLNKHRNLPSDHKGKNPLDQIPRWIKLIILILILISIIVIFELLF